MKDYSYGDYKKQKNFILNYKIVDGEIIINLATGKQLVYPFSKDNEQKVIDMMEAQVSDIDEADFKAKNYLKKGALTIISIFLISLNAYLYYHIFNSTSTDGLGYAGGALVYINLEIIRSIVVIKKQVKDLEKHKFFMEKKEEVNNTKQYSKNIYSGLEKSNINEYEEITINTMDKIKLKELKKFIENIELENSFDMPLKKIDEEEKIKTKVKI